MFRDFSNTILQLEGGYQDHPNDKGNYVDGMLVGTNYGISAPVLQEYLDRSIDKEDMKNLKKSTALDIYKKNYYDAGKYDMYKNKSIAKLIFDTHVNHGTSGRNRIVSSAFYDMTNNQYFLNLREVKDINKLNNLDQKILHNRILEQRKEKYKKGNPVFIEGWLNRLKEFEYKPETLTVKEIATATFIPNIQYPGSTITVASGLFFIFALGRHLLKRK